MLAVESGSSPSRVLRSNFMNALLQSPEAGSRLWHDAHHPDGFVLEMSDLHAPRLCLGGELFGIPTECGATVVSTGSSGESPVAADASESGPRKQRKLTHPSERRHSLPSTVMLQWPPSAMG
ncbi:hypothetical protein ACHAW5_008852 [Stephanodiscus triporus]|uniref:Uncharacterized protein n=1 Tax=Stephanodiscus triporus TaxID=2934178 RepID=A0ABD3NF24_9STRA